MPRLFWKILCNLAAASGIAVSLSCAHGANDRGRWNLTDLGNPPSKGNVEHGNRQMAISSSGDLGADIGTFVYQEVSGDVDLQVRIVKKLVGQTN